MVMRDIDKVWVPSRSMYLYRLKSIRYFLTYNIFNPIFCEIVFDKNHLLFLGVTCNRS